MTRRRHDRIPIFLRVSSPEAGAVLVQNLSEGGMFITCQQALPIGTPLSLTLEGVGRTTLKIDCVVRWVGERGAPPQLGLGVEFEQSSGPARAQIARLLQAVRSTDAIVDDQHSILYADPSPRARATFVEGVRALCERMFGAPDFFHIETVADGRVALEVLRQRCFSLTICEMRLPELSGPDLVRAIRGEISLAMPVFAVASPYPGDHHEALTAGADIFLPKPLQLRGLFNTIVAMVQLQVPSHQAA